MRLSTFLSLLGLLFIALKLTGYITWSWWLVTAPLWFGWVVLAVLALLTFGTAVAVTILIAILESFGRK